MPAEREVRIEKSFLGQPREVIYENGKRVGEYRLEKRGVLGETFKIEYDANGNEVGYSQPEERGGALGLGARQVEASYDRDHRPIGYSQVERRGGIAGLGEHHERVGYDADNNEVSATTWERRGGIFGLGGQRVRVTRFRDDVQPRASVKVQFRDWSRVLWGLSSWIAILRGVASAAVVLPLEYTYQQSVVGEPSISGALFFVFMWVLGHLMAPLMIAILKGVEAF